MPEPNLLPWLQSKVWLETYTRKRYEDIKWSQEIERRFHAGNLVADDTPRMSDFFLRRFGFGPNHRPNDDGHYRYRRWGYVRGKRVDMLHDFSASWGKKGRWPARPREQVHPQQVS